VIEVAVTSEGAEAVLTEDLETPRVP